MNQPYGGGGGTVFTPWQIMDTKGGKRYGLFFEHTDLASLDPDPKNADGQNTSRPGSVVFAEASGSTFKPIARLLPGGGMELFDPDYGSNRGRPRIFLDPQIGVAFKTDGAPNDGTYTWRIRPDGVVEGLDIEQGGGGGGFTDHIELTVNENLYKFGLENQSGTVYLVMRDENNAEVMKFNPYAESFTFGSTANKVTINPLATGTAPIVTFRSGITLRADGVLTGVKVGFKQG